MDEPVRIAGPPLIPNNAVFSGIVDHVRRLAARQRSAVAFANVAFVIKKNKKRLDSLDGSYSAQLQISYCGFSRKFASIEHDVCLVAPTEEERIEARSMMMMMMMVHYELPALEEINADYFNARPTGERDNVYDDINSLFSFNSNLDYLEMNRSNDTIEDAIQTQFTDRGICFDIGVINHRIILGAYMVEANHVR